MALKKFTDVKGKAENSGPERMKLEFGENRFRIVSDVLPRYVYWVKTKDNTSVPLECLRFNRETEKFDNAEKDWVQHYFPSMKCSWAYVSFVIDRADNKLKILDHKKKLFGEIVHAASKLGDPTDPESGWDIVTTKTKTGSQVFNVEYKLETFDLEKAPLSDEDREIVDKMPDIEQVVRRPTPDDQKQFIEEKILDEQEDEDAGEEFDNEIPFDTEETGSSDDLK